MITLARAAELREANEFLADMLAKHPDAQWFDFAAAAAAAEKSRRQAETDAKWRAACEKLREKAVGRHSRRRLG